MMIERGESPLVLLVDDDETLLRLHGRALLKAGFRVESATDGAAAEECLSKRPFDVVLSDIDMPGMNGLALLERIRIHDLDVPVIMITGNPSIETATKAIEHGALRYLVKPVNLEHLRQLVDDAVRLHVIARAKRKALELVGGIEHLVGDQAGLISSFDLAVATLYMAYQPIVSWENKRVFGYEALLRSRRASLPHPGAFIDAAERLGRVHELGRRIRDRAIEPLASCSPDVALFVNLHPDDLQDPFLFEEESPFAQVASRVVLEITERASLSGIPDVPSKIAALRRLGFRVAVDDLGAGYAGLTSFALLEPDIVKLDMALIRGLDTHPTKRALVRSIISMCRELEILVIGEGVETMEERDELARLGCDIMQGYLFARPGEPLPAPSFSP